MRRPVFIGDFCALVGRQRILDEDALAEGEELDSNILSQDFALVRRPFMRDAGERPHYPVTGLAGRRAARPRCATELKRSRGSAPRAGWWVSPWGVR
jgi:hypothetical protein